MNLARLLHASARRLPQAPALARGARIVATYGELSARVARLAGGLRARGLALGDRVAMAMKNCPEYYEVLFACWHAGLAAVPINAKLHAREFEYILENSGAKLAFVTPDLEAAIPGAIAVSTPVHRTLCEAAAIACADVRPDDLAWLFYTSGTTGVPKGAMLTHRNLLFASQAYFTDIDRLGPGDAILHAAPLSHGSGLYGLPHFAAGALNVIPESGGFEPEEIFGPDQGACRDVSFFAAPTMIVRLLASRAAGAADLRNLKTISYGGAPMYVADCERAIELFGPRLYQLFGQGESPMTITGLPQADHAARRHLDSCGYARTGVEVKVFDARRPRACRPAKSARSSRVPTA
jgi:long-chain acyl-CoA synthetase